MAIERRPGSVNELKEWNVLSSSLLDHTSVNRSLLTL